MLKVGIVGLPNAGKSTLFNALLKKQVAFAANYPFATIEPNVGIVPVPDDRLNKLADVVEKEEGKRPPLNPATVEFVDIAGLVAGASQGEGLGNKFLSHIREVDLICHVMRYFPDSDVVHVAGAVDPMRDREIIETELVLADLQTLTKQTEVRGSKDKRDIRRWELISLLKSALNDGKMAKDVIPPGEDRDLIHDLQLLSMKPVLFVRNIGESQVSDPAYKEPLPDTIAICAKVESELAVLSEGEQKEYLETLGWHESGLDRLIRTAYGELGLISFLTCGIKESRAWTIPLGTKAPQAAGTIHTDFEKKFIKADVVDFNDFITAPGWVKAREHGKVRMEGKEYTMQDGDVVEFKIGA